MRIALDVTPLITAGTGVARYARELMDALEGAAVDVRAFAIGRGRRSAPPEARHVRIPLRVVQASWRSLGWPRAEQITGPVDVVHSIDLIAPPTRRPLVITVHDLVALDRPDLHDGRAVAQQRARLSDANRADAVLVPSEATAAALRSRGIASDRIIVVPHGPSRLPPPDPQADATGAILAVGDLAPRKGLDVLLRAAARMRHPVPVVLVGPSHAHEHDLRSLAGELGLGSRLDIRGSVSDAELAGLYDTALALCYPSRAEGFGLPVLEAMAAGLPVVASDLPVLAEVSGGAGALVPVDDPGALADALDRVANDPAEASRMAAAGRQRAATFTWEAAVAATIRAYALALERRDAA